MRQKISGILSIVCLVCLVIAGGCTNKVEAYGDWCFSSMTYSYDGTEKQLLVGGDVSGCLVYYYNNKAIDVGVYEATAVIKRRNNELKKLYATLEIKKANPMVVYDTIKKLCVGDNLPDLVAVDGVMTYLDNTPLTYGLNARSWIYSPNDTHNYNTVMGSVSLELIKPIEIALHNSYYNAISKYIYDNNFDLNGINELFVDHNTSVNIIRFVDIYVPVFDNISNNTTSLCIDKDIINKDTIVQLTLDNDCVISCCAWVVKNQTMYWSIPFYEQYNNQMNRIVINGLSV